MAAGRLIFVLLLALLVPGCAEAPQTVIGATVKDAFTNPTGKITFERQQFIDTYARARQLYITIRDRAAEACRAGQLPGGKCAELAEIAREAKLIDFEIQAKIGVPETQLDWDMIEKVLSFAVKMVL